MIAIAIGGRPAAAAITFLSPTGTTGPGGTITFSELTPGDPTSAFLNTDFTSPSFFSIPIAVTVNNVDGLFIALYGNSVNDTGTTWTQFTATISGDATFNDPNNMFDPYGTYTDNLGWSVSLTNNMHTAVFSGGQIAPNDSLDTFLGLTFTGSPESFTIDLTASSVPEPSGMMLALVGVAVMGAKPMARILVRRRLAILVGVMALAPSSARAAGPQVVAAYAGSFTIAAVGSTTSGVTQMVFGPGGRLFVMTSSGPVSFAYDTATGALTQPVQAGPNISGIGIAFDTNVNMYLTSFDGSLHKLNDANGNGVWGEAGELNVAIATGIPQGDHNIDQLQIVGRTLYVGIGRRTINGHVGVWTSGTLDDLGGKGFFNGGLGRSWGDSAYNGTIAWIQDLTAVADQTGSANAFTTEPPVFSQHLIQKDAGPFTTGGAGKLIVHSAGTRNPFGLCLDSEGGLWFTNNFNRTVTLGNGQAGFGLRGDQLDSDFSHDVQDQLFRAVPGADYGYTDANWRGVNPMLTPGADNYTRVTSVTFDNLFNKGPYTLHNPAEPDGLGPSSSADGCGFSYSTLLPPELQGNIFIARYNSPITEAAPGTATLTYSDLVAVDVLTGKVRQIATGFGNPLAVLADDHSGRLLIADYGDKKIYALQYRAVPCGPALPTK
jgi:glucose/arabinose dehydrogenase